MGLFLYMLSTERFPEAKAIVNMLAAYCLFLHIFVAITAVGGIPTLGIAVESSPALQDLIPARPPECIPDNEDPRWAGKIDANDCESALGSFEQQVTISGDKIFDFWSRQYIQIPPVDGWELPEVIVLGALPCQAKQSLRLATGCDGY